MQGLGIYYRMTEDRVEKRMNNEVDTESIYWLIGNSILYASRNNFQYVHPRLLT